MAASIWDPALRSAFIERSRKLTPETTPGWGKFHAAGMMAHLNDSYRMCIGTLTVPSKNLALRYTPIKQLIIYVLPFSKSAPTAPQLLQRCDAAVLADEQRAFVEMLDTLARVKPGDCLQDHPAFGPLTYAQYGALMAKHTEHHFRQFGL